MLDVVAEGAKGTKKRVHAWKTTRGVGLDDKAGVYFHPHPGQLLSAVEIDSFSRDIERAGTEPVLINFDTLSRCIEGVDEKSAGALSEATGGRPLLHAPRPFAHGCPSH